jgi:DNA (cytosine-5)-methyltransferase 1
MGKPTLLDTFCKAGGAGMGYHLAGFEVVGVDIEHQPHYPFEFIQADALEFIAQHGHNFDVIHASPPCQPYSVTASLSNGKHPALVKQVRAALLLTGSLYVIENVPGAPLINPLMLCGTMFNLRVKRHRLFETSPVIWFPPASCNHWSKIGENGFCCIAGDGSGNSNKYPAHSRRVAAWQAAMGIDWMTKSELKQAIPPAYTKWLGERLIAEIPLRRSNKSR